MFKTGLPFSFSFKMKAGLLLLLVIGPYVKVLAQEKPAIQTWPQIEGIVFDKDTKERVARTNVINASTGTSIYNDLKGAFKISAHSGDVLVFNRADYLPDTVKLTSDANIVVFLKRTAIPLKEVTIYDSLYNPQKRLAATKREYSKAYGPNGNNDMFSAAPGVGAGISIDALWNAFSRSGRNAAHLQEIIQRDYEQDVINYRFNRTFVGFITGLKDKDLTNFMMRYRPGYFLVTNYSDYEFITYIKNNLKRYKRNRRVYQLQPLQPLEPGK